jgi:hypothetical protein
MEDDLTFSGKWKTTSISFINGRRPLLFSQMEDDLKFQIAVMVSIKEGKLYDLTLFGKWKKFNVLGKWKTTSNLSVDGRRPQISKSFFWLV